MIMLMTSMMGKNGDGGDEISEKADEIVDHFKELREGGLCSMLELFL